MKWNSQPSGIETKKKYSQHQKMVHDIAAQKTDRPEPQRTMNVNGGK